MPIRTFLVCCSTAIEKSRRGRVEREVWEGRRKSGGTDRQVDRDK